MTRSDQIWTTAAFSIVGSMMAVFITQLPGCKSGGSLVPYLNELDGASGRIDLRADQIVEDAGAVKKRTDAVGKVHTQRIETNAEQIKADVVVQQKASEDMGKSYSAVVKERDDARREHAEYVAHQSSLWYVKIGRIVDRVIKLAWWLFALLIGGGFVLRIIALFAGGWGGAAMAKIGSIGLHMLPFVGGIANQFFDNYFYRDRQYVLNAPKPAPPVGVVVQHPLDPDGDVTVVSEPVAAKAVAVKRVRRK